MRIFFACFAFMFLLGLPGAVEACTCGGAPTVCGAYAEADAVFIGSVQRIELPPAQKNPQGREYVAGQIAYVQVEKAFKGVRNAQVVFRSWGTSCDAEFKQGERWLFYARYNKENRSWSIGACGRSTRIEGAAEDLLYLQGLPASAQKTHISGRLEHYTDENIIGARVRIIGEKKTYETYTDKNGVYEINGLPPGKYTVEPDIPFGLKVRFSIQYDGDVDYSDNPKREILLKEKGCAGVAFFFNSATHISGRVFGADGRALAQTCLKLTPKDEDDENAGSSLWRIDCTDEQGRYKLDEIPPGEYLLIVNYDGLISSDAPFPTAYYPGTFERQKASVVTLAEGDNLENYDIHIPSQEATRVLQGLLVYSDGQPVADEFIRFEADKVKEGYSGAAGTKTNAQGRFSLTVLQGLTGTLYGFMYTYKGEYENCPQLEKVIKAQGRNVTAVKTRPLGLEINRDIEDIKLVFPFPSCAKAK
jgi:protocatechuate 3,4-dioxygenase beta subunit